MNDESMKLMREFIEEVGVMFKKHNDGLIELSRKLERIESRIFDLESKNKRKEEITKRLFNGEIRN